MHRSAMTFNPLTSEVFCVPLWNFASWPLCYFDTIPLNNIGDRVHPSHRTWQRLRGIDLEDQRPHPYTTDPKDPLTTCQVPQGILRGALCVSCKVGAVLGAREGPTQCQAGGFHAGWLCAVRKKVKKTSETEAKFSVSGLSWLHFPGRNVGGGLQFPPCSPVATDQLPRPPQILTAFLVAGLSLL